MRNVITIDGPAGAGKSTVARLLADRLGWSLLDTGAMYRAVTLAAIRSDVDLSSDRALGQLAQQIEVELLHDGSVLLNDEDVSNEIRSIAVTKSSRYIADSPSVRRCLVDWQRAFAYVQDTVTEGRDQGTIVFPDALLKIFLTASDEERARRRHAQHISQGQPSSFEQVLADQRERDARDRARAIAPMKPADDAILFDSTGLDLLTVIERLAEMVVARLSEHKNESGARPEGTCTP